MRRRHGTTDHTPDFDQRYRADPDPWAVATSWYEQRKLQVLLASLPRSTYKTVWESGCGPGITTRALAARADRLVATDSSRVAIELARERCADLTHVDFHPRSVTKGVDDGPVELVVAAEYLYYVDDLAAAIDCLWSAAAWNGHIAVLHWAHRPHDGHLSGTDVHRHFAAAAIERSAELLVAHTEPDFVLDIYEVR